MNVTNVIFTKEHSNYNKDNIIDILKYLASLPPYGIGDMEIRHVLYNDNYNIIVKGDIHKSQYISDNTNDSYWISIGIHRNSIGIP